MDSVPREQHGDYLVLTDEELKALRRGRGSLHAERAFLRRCAALARTFVAQRDDPWLCGRDFCDTFQAACVAGLEAICNYLDAKRRKRRVSHFASYLGRAVWNGLSDHFRHQWRMHQRCDRAVHWDQVLEDRTVQEYMTDVDYLLSEHAQDDPSRAAETHEFRQRFHDEMGHLDGDLLQIWEEQCSGATLTEAAIHLGRSYPAVKRSWKKFQTKMRKKFPDVGQ